ncbi:MAG: META domain-containing protein [Betaproteobacteria bacterium]|jgi:copper homeostasis protein (lipoprotein)|nr:META domain-containing protein [Betaproteobacteria bacterium]
MKPEPIAHAARWTIAVFALLLLAACAGSGGPPAPLVGTVWNVREAGGAAFKPLKGGRDAHLRLDAQKKRATGYSGVNSFAGAYQSAGTALKFGPIAATRRAGPPAAMAFETAYFKALGATRAYRIAGDQLELLDADGEVRARLEALPPL